jgi:hypothetical protein
VARSNSRGRNATRLHGVGLAAGQPAARRGRSGLGGGPYTESLPFLASLLSSPAASEQERGIYGLSAFANGCPAQTHDTVVNMSYLQCGTSPYRTADTFAHFAFRPGTAAQQAALVAYWQNWWNAETALH